MTTSIRTGWDLHIRNYWDREHRVAAQERALCEKAQAEAAHLAQLLATRFGVQRIVLFGSSLAPERFDGESDIDLAVLGLPSDRYFEALSAIEQAASFPIDLVEIEHAKPALLRNVEEEGLPLYG